MRIRANFSILSDRGRTERFHAIETVNGNPRKMLSRRIDDAVNRVVTRVLTERTNLDGRVRYEGYSLLQGETVFTSEMWGNRG